MAGKQTVAERNNGGAVATVEQKMMQQSAVVTLAERMGVAPTDVFMAALRNVAFRTPEVSNDQLMALVVVSNQYKLNPFTREIYAFPDKKTGGIVPVVSIDGWLRIINEQEQLNGLTYAETFKDDKLDSGTCTIYRKDREHPTVISESYAETKRSTDPWNQMPRRMLRHKAIIQCARVAFGFAGIYEPDEADRIMASERVVPAAGATGVDAARALLAPDPAAALAGAKDPTVIAEQPAQPVATDDDGQGSLPV